MMSPSKLKHYISSSWKGETMYRVVKASKDTISQVLLDFIHDGDYDGDAIAEAVDSALQKNNCYLDAHDFYSVDYSNIPEYETANVSQFQGDFYNQGYDYRKLSEDIESAVFEIGYEVIGIDFQSLSD